MKLLETRPGKPWWMQPEYDNLPAMRFNLRTNLTKLQRLVWADEFLRHEYILAFTGETETVQTKNGPQQRKKYLWKRVRIDDARIVA